VTATANPPNITYMGHTMCPDGLSSGLSRALRLPQCQARGLATPNIGYMGQNVPKLAVMGRRRHRAASPQGASRALSLVLEHYSIVKVQRLCGQTLFSALILAQI